MWQRFTEAARRSVFLAQEEAKQRGQKFVSTEHLLLGLIRADGGIAIRILLRLEISPDRVEAEIEKKIEDGPSLSDPDMQLTPRSKFVLDRAFAEARQLQHSYIGTGHMLLAIIGDHNGLAGQVLNALGADIEKARRVAQDLTTEESAKEVVNDSSVPPARSADVGPTDTRTTTPSAKGDAVSRWGRFSDSARHVVFLAQEEATRLGHAEVDPEHCLLAILSKPTCKASRLIYTLEIPTEPIRARILARLTPRTPVIGADITLADRTKRLFDNAFEESRNSDDDLLDTQHLLLALLDEGEGVAFEALTASSVYISSVRSLSRILDAAPTSNTDG